MSINAVMPEFVVTLYSAVTALHEHGLHQDVFAALAVLDGIARRAVHKHVQFPATRLYSFIP
jgi:hypothetical protein